MLVSELATTVNVLRCMEETGVERFVFSSTCATYGTPTRVPIAEDGFDRVDGHTARGNAANPRAENKWGHIVEMIPPASRSVSLTGPRRSAICVRYLRS